MSDDGLKKIRKQGKGEKSTRQVKRSNESSLRKEIAIEGVASHQEITYVDTKKYDRALRLANNNELQSSSSRSVQPFLEKESNCIKEISDPLTSDFSVHGVYFRCPFLGEEILTKTEWRDKLKKYLEERLITEKSRASCLIIHSLNYISESKKCIEKLCSIINNIILYPTEEKYKKIRIMNRVFQDCIAKIEGAIEFLESVGFLKTVVTLNSISEDYYIFPITNPDISHLQKMIDLLLSTQPITLELYRNAEVLKSSHVVRNLQIPDEFYIRTPGEIKREQQNKSESLDNLMQLKTKAMREKDKLKNIKNYRYTLIRVRFPDGVCLQATFGVFESLGNLRSFIREYVIQSVESFSLKTALGVLLSECKDNETLNELNLVPAVLLIFEPVKTLSVGLSYLIPKLCHSFKE